MPAELDLDLTQPHAIHVVGVGGAGMSAIATVLARMGHTVSGSDLRESRALERLGLLDVTTHIGHAAENLPAVLDAVVISTAIPEGFRRPGAAAIVVAAVLAFIPPFTVMQWFLDLQLAVSGTVLLAASALLVRPRRLRA